MPLRCDYTALQKTCCVYFTEFQHLQGLRIGGSECTEWTESALFSKCPVHYVVLLYAVNVMKTFSLLKM